MSWLYTMSGPRVTLGEIVDLERATGLRLPDDYRFFLMTVDLAKIGPLRFRRGGPHPFKPATIQDFVQPTSGQSGLAQLYTMLQPHLPRGILVIASTATGDYVAIDLRRRNESPVLLIDHEALDEFGPVRSVVADSFMLFIASLEPV